MIVLGSARGGTTMVAAVLQALGVFMGEKLGPVLEDVALSKAVESRDSESIGKIATQRNAEHAVWGWKRPSALEYSDAWKGQFRNPYFIAIFRDPFAIANRNRISMLSDVFPDMERSVQYFGHLVAFLRKQNAPLLLCSYEKAIAAPEKFVRAVDDFLGLNSAQAWAAAASRINVASREYLETSRITNSLGHLDTATERYCSGWAFYPKQPARPAMVQISVNGELMATVPAQLPRPDVKQSGAHPTGNCGFRFEWSPGALPQIGDRVEARAEGDTSFLNGSPRLVAMKSAKTIGNTLPKASVEKHDLPGALPSFYGLGAQKAGTTWIYEMLKRHPQIHLPKRKEIHYWDKNSSQPLQWYRDHFVPGRINGDVTPAYAVLLQSDIAKVHRVTPRARLLFSMRNPIERSWSFVQMAVSRNFETVPHDLKAGDPRGDTLKFVRQKLFHAGSIARNDYAGTIRRWREQFGSEALMVFRYERIMQDPRDLLQDICRHIGADPAWADSVQQDVLAQRVFSFDQIPFPPALRAECAERCAPYIDDLEQLLGERFNDWRS